jgi:hypothetical protein
MKRRAVLALLATTGALVGCRQVGGLVARPGAPAPGTRLLEDIQDVGELEARFDADAGKPRLVILVSPT